MPSLNQCEFIEPAVRSVLEQNDVAVELLVSDGGSCDGTLAVLEKLAIEFAPRLLWISGTDTGPANAVNKALQSARGEIIGWLNADDLYAPDAISVATHALRADPDLVVVYGEGEHVDGAGRSIARYPTRPPSAGIEAFQAGCFICQPTVFLRRQVFDQIGALNEKLSTAFDFDLWLRIFLNFPGRIGYTDRVQAYSRVHGRTITSRQRRIVAAEAATLLSTHLGQAEPHWILTYIDEAVRCYPSYEPSSGIREHVSNMIAELSRCFDRQGLQYLHACTAQDKRLTEVPLGLHATMFPDGWAGPELCVRIRSPLGGSFSLVLDCENRRPVVTPLTLSINTNRGDQVVLPVERRRKFSIVVEFSDVRLGQFLFVSVRSDSTFIPQISERGSNDTRELAFRITRISLVDS
jgi:glycosyltransferase involved in cell wall biosynthesis